MPPLDDSWADDVLDAHAREGEILSDDDLAVLRLERHQRELVDLFVTGLAIAHGAMLETDEKTARVLRDEGYDADEVAEAFRRVAWLQRLGQESATAAEAE
jgi:hypothetical protein